MRTPEHDTLDLATVVDLMRALSLQTDPQEAASLYGRGITRLNLAPNDRYLSVSRRDLPPPQYRITRNTAWTSHPNPWTEKHKLPILSGGLLADILYSNQPAIIKNLPEILSQTDPAYHALAGMQLLIALPHYDNGQAINVGILLNESAADFPYHTVPMMVWQANLWGRATLNLVTKQQLQAAHDAMDRELKVVADIQRSLLPKTLPQIPGADLAAHYQTSQRAGGDYYDFFPLPDGRFGILLADVSGHGTPAAVLMAITHAIAHARPGHPIPPEDLLCFVNEKLAAIYTSNNGNFVTAFYAIYNPATRSLAYASAGHPPPRLVRVGQLISLDGESSLPLGIHHHERFLSHTLQLQPADRLLFFTDGITDSFNPEGEAFGTARLDHACVSPGCSPTADALLQSILTHLTTFTQNTPPTDDRTMVALVIT